MSWIFTFEQDLSGKLSLELGISGIYTDYPDYVFFKRIDIGQRKPGISTAEQLVEGRGLGFRAGLKSVPLFRRQPPPRLQRTRHLFSTRTRSIKGSFTLTRM